MVAMSPTDDDDDDDDDDDNDDVGYISTRLVYIECRGYLSLSPMAEYTPAL